MAEINQLYVSEKVIKFPECSVGFVVASFDQINQLIFPTNILAEIRIAATTADFFLEYLDRQEQIEWNNELAGRIAVSDADIAAVCLLDTGVNRQHPLLEPTLAEKDMHTYNPDWLAIDHNSHGTKMAGLAVYGDLTDVLQEAGPIQIGHRLESVKILPPQGNNPHDLFGSITKEGVARAEIGAPDRKRVLCLAITSRIDRNMGMPSSWSAAIDSLAAAVDEDGAGRRLFFIAAGNADPNEYHNYPASNFTDQVNDPAQSWNALTVGAFTEKTHIPADSQYVGCTVVAPTAVLSPHSTTSLAWKDMWPNKPDIVMEGGNLAQYAGSIAEIEPLRLVTTDMDWPVRPFADFGATSASTALASRYGAAVLSQYPDLWPETIRGLIVHSASWTEEMLAEKQGDNRALVRCYGYGVPDLAIALESAANSLTLVVEDSLQPFIDKGGRRRSNEMNLHELPWARDVLLGLGEVGAEMRVTLSYFIEPNPSSKGFSSKHRYASHQLNFDTVRSEETRNGFRQRVNVASRVPEAGAGGGSIDSQGWFLKHKLRSKGSVHSDIWRGSSADLATKNLIAVYPVGGWWKDLKSQARWNASARYSLIVSIKTQEVDVDLYSVIQNQIAVPNVIVIEH